MVSRRPRTGSPAAALLAALGLALGVLAAHAQGVAVPPEGPSIDDLKQRLAAAKARADLDPAASAKLQDAYKAAIAEAEAAAAARAETATLQKEQAAAPKEIQALEQQAAVAADKPLPPPPAGIDQIPLSALEALKVRIRADVAASRATVADLERRINDIPFRLHEARRTLATLRAEVKQQEALAGAGPPAGIEGDEAARAAADLVRARLDARRARLDRLEHDIAFQPTQARLLTLQRDIALSELAAHETEARELETLLEQRRNSEIAALRAEADSLKARAASATDPALAIAAQAKERDADLAATNLAIDRALAEATAKRKELTRLEQRAREVKQRAQIGDNVEELPRLLTHELRALFRSDSLATARTQRALEADRIAEERAAVRRRRDELADVNAAARALVDAQGAAIPAERRAAVERSVRQQLVAERNVLSRLDAQQSVLLLTLSEIGDAEADLADRTRQAREDVVRLLFWVPLSPLGAETLAQLSDLPAWLFARASWQSAAAAGRAAMAKHPLRTLTPFLVALVLFAARRRLLAALPALTPAAVGHARFTIGHSLAALATSVALALPLPAALWGLGAPLRTAADVPSLVVSFGAALQWVAGVLLAVRTTYVLLDDNGVAAAHFQWSRTVIHRLRRAMRLLFFGYAPCVFVATLATYEAPEAARESLGRLGFVGAMFVMATFLRFALRPDGEAPAPRGAEPARGAVALGRRLLAWLVPLVPVALAGVAAVGYYFAAIYVYQLFNISVLIGLAALMLYGLIAVWAATQRTRLAQVRARAEAASAEAAVSPEGAPGHATTLDVEAIDRATRQFLNTVITVAVVLALWALWHEAFPAFDRIGNQVLWSYTEKVDNATVVRSLTVAGFFSALIVGIVAFVATKNAGGMLDVILLRRLALQPDANYAIKTVTRYVIAGVGLIAVTQLVGVNWGRAQWLVAALGVGLGFGLQEIVANFVSGLIVLAERPIRLNDLVTVGATSGKVTRIRARATVITDYENKEVLIPNKEFITARVVNWTLSSETTRLLLKVGVGYGTDPEQAQRVIEAAVREVPGVLADPAPSVYFTEFGDSALTFEIRVYCAKVADRLPLTHALNTTLFRALAAAGIEIPFPQRDVNLRTVTGLPPATSEPPSAPSALPGGRPAPR